MGTIDISYYNLFIGLLLLAIPFFYLWKFKTGLLKPAVIGTLRMIIQLFFIGMEQSLDQLPLGDNYGIRGRADRIGTHPVET